MFISLPSVLIKMQEDSQYAVAFGKQSVNRSIQCQVWSDPRWPCCLQWADGLAEIKAANCFGMHDTSREISHFFCTKEVIIVLS